MSEPLGSASLASGLGPWGDATVYNGGKSDWALSEPVGPAQDGAVGRTNGLLVGV